MSHIHGCVSCSCSWHIAEVSHELDVVGAVSMDCLQLPLTACPCSVMGLRGFGWLVSSGRESPTPVACVPTSGRSRKECFAPVSSAPTGTCPQCQVPLHFPSLHVPGSQCVGAPQTHQQWNLVPQPQERAGVAAFQNRAEGPFCPSSREPRIHHQLLALLSHHPFLPRAIVPI